MISPKTTLDYYIKTAGNNQVNDFKVTNGTENVKYISELYKYRGMPIGSSQGETLFSSARDIGNIAAGIVAAKNGMPWFASRIAFDTYQSHTSNKLSIEGISTRNAEYYGWRMMHQHSNTQLELFNLTNSIIHYIKNK